MYTLREMLDLARVAFEVEDFNKALGFYKMAMFAWPNDARGHFGAATVYDTIAQGEEARKSYLKAISLDPFNRKYHTRYVCCLIDQGLLGEAGEPYMAGQTLLEDPDLRIDPSLYEEYHAEVALHLLHAGFVFGAGRVLNDIPPVVANRNHDIQNLFLCYAELQLEEKETIESLYLPHVFSSVSKLPPLRWNPSRYLLHLGKRNLAR